MAAVLGQRRSLGCLHDVHRSMGRALSCPRPKHEAGSSETLHGIDLDRVRVLFPDGRRVVRSHRVRRPIVIAFAVAIQPTGVCWVVLPAAPAGGVLIAAVFTGLAVPGFHADVVDCKGSQPARSLPAWRSRSQISAASLRRAYCSRSSDGWWIAARGMVTAAVRMLTDSASAILASWSFIGVVAACRISETVTATCGGHKPRDSRASRNTLCDNLPRCRGGMRTV